jgi:hypothetical protein
MSVSMIRSACRVSTVRFLQSRRRVNASAGSFNRGRDLALRQSIRHIMPIVAHRQRTTSSPPASKVTFNSDLIYDVLRRHEPDRATRPMRRVV